MVVAVIVMVQVVPGIEVDSFAGYVQVAVLMALVNTIVKPIVKLFTAPIILITLGLAMFVINAILLRVVIGAADDASIDGFGSALVGSIVLTLASFAVGWILSMGEGEKAAVA
jgi:putative membrane protein